jgi:hypothetical protein
MLTALGVFAACVLFFAWFWVTGPLLNPLKRAAAIPSVDSARIEGHVRKVTEMFSPRDFSHPENLDRAAAYISGEFEKTAGKVSDQPFQVGGRTYRNVVASFGPETEEVIVVGAHYDTHGELPGADDNASGVAGLLELAVLLGSERLPRRVELVAYALEEMPFFGSRVMGSAIHARSLHDTGIRVRAMFSLEMIGYFSDEPGSQKFPAALLRLFYPNRGDFIAVVGRLRDGRLVRCVKASMASAADLPVHSINAPPWIPGVDLSDHASYWQLGIPAVMITDTAFYRNERYHTEEDTPETLDYARMAKVVEGVLRAVLDLARA